MTPISYTSEFSAMTDTAIVQQLCRSLKQMRLSRNLSQAGLARRSGINRVTISRIESGQAATLLTLVQILRALDKLDILSVFHQEPEISPLQMLRVQEKQRKKAYGPRKTRTVHPKKGTT